MIESLIKKASSIQEDVQLVKQGNIFFLILNDHGDNSFDLEKINKISGFLDQVNKSEGAAVMITVSTSPKIFSTGFKLEYWSASVLNPLESIPAY